MRLNDMSINIIKIALVICTENFTNFLQILQTYKIFNHILTMFMMLLIFRSATSFNLTR